MASILDALEQNLETAKETHKNEESSGGGGRKFSVGLLITGRLIPYMTSAGTPRFIETMYHHYYTGADNKWHFLYCPKNLGWDEVCEICEPMKTHYDEFGSDSVYNNFKRKRKYKTNFYVTGVKKLSGFTVDDAAVKAWEEVVNTVIKVDLPWSLKEKIDAALDNPELGTRIYNPMSGYDLSIRITEKKTDEGTFPNYDTSDFGRTLSMIAGCETREDLEKVLESADDLKSVIAKEVEKDRPKIRPAAIDESLLIDDGSSTTKPAATPKSSETTATPNVSAAEALATGSGNQEQSAPPEQTSSEDAGGGDESALSSIFAKYR